MIVRIILAVSLALLSSVLAVVLFASEVRAQAPEPQWRTPNVQGLTPSGAPIYPAAPHAVPPPAPNFGAAPAPNPNITPIMPSTPAHLGVPTAPVTPTTNTNAAVEGNGNPHGGGFRGGAGEGERRGSRMRVSRGSGTLPNDHGQVWREYDISPYTSRIQNTEKPEQAVIDWILRETGTDVWFSEPLGVLSANRNTLRVYHTPAMQQVVGELVDRFVNRDVEAYEFGVRLVTVANPNWRAKAMPILRPVTVQTPGLEAWLLSREDAAVLMADLRRRTDFREYNSPNVTVYNGQQHTLSRTRPISYAKSVLRRDDVPGGYELEMAQIEDGFHLDISPLLSLDGKTIDAVIKCQADQVERITPISFEIATAFNPRQKVNLQLPQMASWRIHERFRWPSDQVLLISRGVVAVPAGGQQTALGIPNPFDNSPPRADALLMLDGKGIATLPNPAATTPPTAEASPAAGSLNYRGRY